MKAVFASILVGWRLAAVAHAVPLMGPPPRDTVGTKTRTTVELAPGVYVIRHEDAPDTFPQSNTTVVIGEREVLVVDSCYLPLTAVQDVAQIRAWTPKPVRWLVNTHWHYDHTMGNGVYRDAFPGITVVAHVETRQQIAGYNPQWFAKFPERSARFQKVIDAGKDESGRALSPAEIAEYKDALAGLAPVGREFAPLGRRNDLAPTLGFEKEIDVDLGGREVRVLHLGRGNTAGDAVVFLPRERIVAAGDLVVSPVPYMSGGFPVEMIDTLGRLEALDFGVLVPGHGRIQYGKSYVAQLADFLRAVVTAVRAEVNVTGAGSLKLEDVKRGVRAKFPVAEWTTRFAGDDAEARDFFDSFSLDGAIIATYAETWSR